MRRPSTEFARLTDALLLGNAMQTPSTPTSVRPEQGLTHLGPERCVHDRPIGALGVDKKSPPGRPSGALRCGDLLCQFKLTHQGCQSILTDMDIENLSLNLSSDDPAIGLRASLALHRLAERVEANHVASAREKGWSWQQIGDALGVTRQSVHTKYNKESS